LSYFKLLKVLAKLKMDSRNLKIGILADVQYADEDDCKLCTYRSSLSRLEDAVLKLNEQKVDFVVQLGDLINGQWDSFGPTLKLLKRLTMPVYNVLGNHDFIVENSQKMMVPALLGMPSRYYSFVQSGYRFIFLDGNDLSFNAHIESSPMYEYSQKVFDARTDEVSEWWNGAISQQQLAWLKGELRTSTALGEETYIFCHFPLTQNSRYALWNAREVRALIERFPSCRAWFSGHIHQGHSEMLNGILHHTFKGIVEGHNFAVLEFKDGKCIV
jgi:manganese-dependent ADP-ribose/CDP-alcohol diphosphatase